MIYEILSIMAPVLACAAIGFFWSRAGYAFDSEFVSRLVLHIGAPCLMLSALGSVDIDLQTFQRTALACVLVALLMAVLGVVVPKLMGHSPRALLPSLVFPNVGNMGLPICMLAFGEEGLALALAFFMVLSIAHFPVGMLLAGSNSGGSKSTGLSMIFKMPVMYAIAIGVFLLWSGWTLPQPLTNATDVIGGLTIPLMLIALGVSLSRLKIQQWQSALFYSVVRMGGGLLVGLLVVHWLGLTGIERGVVLIQAAMPVAVFNYLFADRYNREPETVAGLVVMSTLISFISLPILLGWLAV